MATADLDRWRSPDLADAYKSNPQIAPLVRSGDTSANLNSMVKGLRLLTDEEKKSVEKKAIEILRAAKRKKLFASVNYRATAGAIFLACRNLELPVSIDDLIGTFTQKDTKERSVLKHVKTMARGLGFEKRPVPHISEFVRRHEKVIKEKGEVRLPENILEQALENAETLERLHPFASKPVLAVSALYREYAGATGDNSTKTANIFAQEVGLSSGGVIKDYSKLLG